jgi:hypothetical protein
MTVRYYILGILFSCCLSMLFSCGEKPDGRPMQFTKTDSLTETYLALQDSMLQSWNMMITDDNQKIDAMLNLIHELTVSGPADPELMKSYRERIEQLRRLRYTQKTMANIHVIEEYDFASNALVSELIALTESQKQFAYNSTLQKLADIIRTADQRVYPYREQYDQVTMRYNEFVQRNKKFLTEIDTDSLLEKKPLFQMVAEDN